MERQPSHARGTRWRRPSSWGGVATSIRAGLSKSLDPPSVVAVQGDNAAGLCTAPDRLPMASAIRHPMSGRCLLHRDPTPAYWRQQSSQRVVHAHRNCGVDRRLYLRYRPFAPGCPQYAGGFNRWTQQIGEIVQRVFRSLAFSLGGYLVASLLHLAWLASR